MALSRHNKEVWILLFIISLSVSVAAQDMPIISGSEGAKTIRINGFMDASYLYTNNPNTSTFGFDEAEVDLENDVGEIGNARLDLEWTSDGNGGFSFDLEQGFITLKFPGLRSSELTFGKFNAPMGCEPEDTAEKTQYSYSLVSTYSCPENLTGLMVYSDISNSFGLTLFVTNGWNQNVDFKKGKNVGGRIEFASEEKLSFGVSSIYGSESADNETKVALYEVDCTYNPFINLLLSGNVSYGESRLPNEKARWMGYYIATNYNLTDRFGLTSRYDYFNDINGSRLEHGVAEKLHSISLAPMVTVPGGIKALMEYRINYSILSSRLSGFDSRYNANQSLAFEMIYVF